MADILTKKWKEDKEERMEEHAKADEQLRIENERAEYAESMQREMVDYFKMASEAIIRGLTREQ